MIEIYGKKNCAMCEAAKALLDSKGIAYDYKTLDEDFTRDEILAKVPGARQFPQIFADGVSIGSFNELRTKLPLLEQSGLSGGRTVLLG
jgi:glutaredoxin 3